MTEYQGFIAPITCTYCENPARLWRLSTPEDECDPGREPICDQCAEPYRKRPREENQQR